jgi:hypothetical protein
MADKLSNRADTSVDGDLREDHAAPARANSTNLARVQAVPWLLFILALAALGWLAYKYFTEDDLGDPIATSLTAFEKQNRLTVFSAQLSPVVSSEDSRLFGAIKSRQVAVIPARVDYTLDLSEVEANQLSWDAETQTLDVQLPRIQVGTPNLDEARAQYLREGIWISRDAQDRLNRNNTRLAEKQAREAAGNPVLVDLARDAARSAVTQNLSIPLQVAGYSDVKVNVRFDGEAAGGARAAPSGTGN